MATLVTKNITPAVAAEVLAANGLFISEKEAEAVADFLYTLAILNAKND
jgi:hypothetical protein